MSQVERDVSDRHFSSPGADVDGAAGLALTAPRFRSSAELVQGGVVLCDILLTVGIVLISSLLADVVIGPDVDRLFGDWPIALSCAAVFVGIFSIRGGYRLEALGDARRQVRGVCFSFAMVFFALGWVAFLSKTTASYSRSALTLSFVLGLGVLSLAHLWIATILSRWLADRSLSLRRVVVIGQCDQHGRSRIVEGLGSHGIEVVDFIHLSAQSQNGRGSFAAACREVASAVRVALAARPVEGVYLFMPWRDRRSIDELRATLCPLPVPIHLFADGDMERVLQRRQIRFGDFHGFELQRAPLDKFDRAQKRALDILAASAALLLLSPIMAMTAIAILVEGKGPILFRQNRKGFGGRPFEILKFRTMTVLENGAVIEQAKKNDARVTPLGAVLRRTSIDELPQLINVLKGEMSIVGPRPHAIAHDNLYDRIIARYAFRHHVKPGITGWAQVNGFRGETRDVAQMEARVEHDLWYINNWSIWLDIRILFKTAIEVLWQKNAY